MKRMPSSAMVLAAGLGLRMRPLTLELPKPLVKVAGKTLLDWTLDSAAAGGIARVVINVHHLGDKIITHTARRERPAVMISDETDRLLDTGGGIVKALPLLGDAPFFVFNGDVFDFKALRTKRLDPLLNQSLSTFGNLLAIAQVLREPDSCKSFDWPIFITIDRLSWVAIDSQFSFSWIFKG